MMTDSELLHYARQLLLSEVDVSGQKLLKDSHVVVLGLGGLGSPLAMYLGAAGVGRLTLVDGDTVDETNLHRQVIHSQTSLNRQKVDSARDRILGINPWIDVGVIPEYADEGNVVSEVLTAQCIADCTDRFATRFLANQLAWNYTVPVVSAAALGLEGQLTTIDPRIVSNPCYACFTPDIPEVEPNCAETGVLGPVVGTLGALQAVEVLGILLDWPGRLVGRLMRFHAKTMEWRSFTYRKDPACQVCNSVSKF
ncbi:MAG: molybdopterin-synthase adenylyltransferase MoeB [Gammaproteobacteria bacterium]|nr:molybdopterin-synthase adenylyltransferase MoeB [Gammaproteobacteria bacterium]|tara:strand:- start:2420 stop:3178 length:759 start_codon:yes stop_codon:yes gene_type:complete